MHDTAARELRRLGARVPSASSAPPTHDHRTLTAREREIADLVAKDTPTSASPPRSTSATDRRQHLTRIYAKLGIRSRTQLARTLTHP